MKVSVTNQVGTYLGDGMCEFEPAWAGQEPCFSASRHQQTTTTSILRERNSSDSVLYRLCAEQVHQIGLDGRFRELL